MKWGQRIVYVMLTGAIIVMFVSVGAGVASRYLVGIPLFWTDELARFALVWMTFLGAAVLLIRSDGHIRFELIQNLLSPRINVVLEIVCDIVIVLTLVVILIGSVLMIQSSGRHMSPALSIPMPIVYSVIPLSAVIGISVTLWRLVQRLLAPYQPH